MAGLMIICKLYVTKWQLTDMDIKAIILLLFQIKQEGGYDDHEQIVIRNSEAFNYNSPTYSYQGYQSLTK